MEMVIMKIIKEQKRKNIGSGQFVFVKYKSEKVII
jgi:hypothetical protein